MHKLLLHGDLLTPDGLIKDGYLGVDGACISYIGKQKPEAMYACEKDMQGKLMIPGLVNAHTHAAMTLLRGQGSDRPLEEWLFDCIVPIEDRYTDADFAAGNALALMEMIACGTTSFSDMYFQSHLMIEAMLEAGMKGNIDRCVQSFDPDENPRDNHRVRECLALYEQYNGAGEGRVLVDFALHAVYTCTEPVIRYTSEQCMAHNGRLHLHLSETEKERVDCIAAHGKTPTAYFNDLGVFENPSYAAHCVTVTKEDMDILDQKGVSVVHNPTSNLKLGSGIAPIPEMLLARDINVALGTDGAASNNNLNMFEEMHLAALLPKGFEKAPGLLSAREVFRMATLGGARAQGRTDTGELIVGNRADIVAIDMDKPHLYPSPDPYATLVYSAQGSDVCMTMVDGRILYENGAYLTIDVDKVKYDAKAAVKRLLGE